MNGRMSLRFLKTLLFAALATVVLCMHLPEAARAANVAPPIDARSLVQVQSRAALPKDVTTALGWHKTGAQGIADAREKFNATDVVDARLPQRHFIVGGASPTSVLVAYEQGGFTRSIHAVGFSLGGSGWSKAGEWTLDAIPYTLSSLLDVVEPGIPTGAWWRKTRSVRIRNTEPSRRDGPLRELNLSDDEVREIQSAALQTYPGSILNISGVVTGCPCEEGQECTDQVWIVAHRDGQTHGLQLSRIGSRWRVGTVQQWWLEFAQLRASRSLSPSAYTEQIQALYDRFPACSAKTVVTAPTVMLTSGVVK
jgi:hypothetical protein